MTDKGRAMADKAESDALLALAQETLPNFRWERSGRFCAVYGRSDCETSVYLGLAGYKRDDPLDQLVSQGRWWVVDVTGSSVISRMRVGQETYFRTPEEGLQSVVEILRLAGQEMLRLAAGQVEKQAELPKKPNRDGIWHKYNECVWRAVMGPYVAQVFDPASVCRWSVWYVHDSGAAEDFLEPDVEVAKAKAMAALADRYNRAKSFAQQVPS